MKCDRCGRDTKFMTIIDIKRMIEDFPAQGYRKTICYQCASHLDEFFFKYGEDSSITEWHNLD